MEADMNVILRLIVRKGKVFADEMIGRYFTRRSRYDILIIN